MEHPLWLDNGVQFPRLLAEIAATQNLEMKALAESMDLSLEEVNELFDRANTAWENAEIEGAPRTMVDLQMYKEDGTPMGMATWELTTDDISGVMDQAAQAVVAWRERQDLTPIMEELEGSLISANLLDYDFSDSGI